MLKLSLIINLILKLIVNKFIIDLKQDLIQYYTSINYKYPDMN